MKTPKKTFIALSAASTLPCSAAVIASTHFDGRVLNPSNTAIDNLSINGTVGVIPEPSSLALLALGFFGLMRRRR